MKRIKENLRDQGILFSTHFVGDRLPEDHEVHLFSKLIDQLDLSSLYKSYSPEGGEMYSPRDLLAIVVYGYFKGITSSVALGELTSISLPFIFLAGGHVISSRTIRRFRIKHQALLQTIFSSTVALAIDSGLVNVSDVFALDGSKFEANASFAKTLKKKEWQARQKKILEKVDKYLEDWAIQDALEEGLEEERKKKFDEVTAKLDKLKASEKEGNSEKDEEKSGDTTKESNAVARKKSVTVNSLDKASELLNEHEAVDNLLNNFPSEKDDLLFSLTDPDCRVMQNDSTTKESYNVQIITNNQVIVAADVTQDENDQAQLEPMVEQLEENIGISEKIKLLADAGYNKGKNLAFLDEKKNIDPYISMHDRAKAKGKNPFLKENFSFDEDNEQWMCPQGKHLEFMKEHIQDGKKHTLFGGKLEHCLHCPVNKQCITTKADQKRGYRTLDDDNYTVYRQEMIEKLSHPEAKALYKKRGCEVEPVFGQIKWNRGFSQFRLRGRKKVNAEFLISSIGHNLGKLIKHIKKNSTLKEMYAF